MSSNRPLNSVQRIERAIVRKLIANALAEGLAIDVDDGEEVVLRRSQDATAIFNAMFSTDEAHMHLFEHDNTRKVGGWKRLGWIGLTYGNSGYDVISDGTTNLSELRWYKNVEKYIDDLENDREVLTVNVEWHTDETDKAYRRLFIDGELLVGAYIIVGGDDVMQMSKVQGIQDVLERLAALGVINYSVLPK